MFPHQSTGEMLRDWLDDKLHTPVIDVDAAVRQLQRQALDHYNHHCAKFVFTAINAGIHGPTKAVITDAWKAGPSLEKVGFRRWTTSLDNYIPKKGDVVVLQPYPGQPGGEYGHMAMFDGEKWISDKAQDGRSGMWSNLNFRDHAIGPMAIYRP